MSDFDKEAEREKLREQFAADEEKREATERMSNLLLQGATMTNTHCDTCSSPIFTYEGQAFCPTCQVEVDAGGEGATAGPTEPDADPTDADRPESTASPEAGADSGTSRQAPDGTGGSATRIGVDDPGANTDPRSSTPAEPHASSEPSRPEPTGDRRAPPASEPTDVPDPASVSSPGSDLDVATAPVRERTGGAEGGDTDLTAARASLSRTLTRLSSEAERSEDLSRTREYLLATREAAEALGALEQARR